MLKTQLTKAIYLWISFCFFITTSFAPSQNLSPAISFTKKRVNVEASFVKETPSPPSTYYLKEKLNTVLPSAPKVKLNKHQLQFAKNYIRTSVESLVNVKQRSKIPFSIMDSVFSRYGLPVELKYLAVIESELKSSALSCVGALGPWQLMPATAHILGLKITRQYDERTNYYKSTKAAAKYLKDLYAQFDDWLLVLAAYNSGPGPVCSAIHKSGSRNFWALQNYLPAETREHVKKFIATHYYFEGQGSVTTLTKAENIEYAKSVNAFAISHSTAEPSKEKEVKWHTTTVTGNTRDITGLSVWKGFYKSNIENIDTPFQKNEKTSRGKESKEEHFKRLMKESEESLQKANKMIEG